MVESDDVWYRKVKIKIFQKFIELSLALRTLGWGDAAEKNRGGGGWGVIYPFLLKGRWQRYLALYLSFLFLGHKSGPNENCQFSVTGLGC